MFSIRQICCFLLVVFCFYMAYQVFYSDYSLHQYLYLRQNILAMHKELDDVRQKNLNLSQKILKLKRDKNYLRFLIRKKLGYVSAGEKLFLIH